MKPRLKLGRAGTVTVIDVGGGNSVDSVAMHTLEQAVRFYGIRAVLFALEKICDDRAERSVENFNAEQAKQWAVWSTELECIVGSSKLKEPGRE